jgi:hypothetical protein
LQGLSGGGASGRLAAPSRKAAAGRSGGGFAGRVPRRQGASEKFSPGFSRSRSCSSSSSMKIQHSEDEDENEHEHENIVKNRYES